MNEIKLLKDVTLEEFTTECRKWHLFKIDLRTKSHFEDAYNYLKKQSDDIYFLPMIIMFGTSILPQKKIDSDKNIVNDLRVKNNLIPISNGFLVVRKTLAKDLNKIKHEKN